MRITESKLRSIIRQVIKESAPYVPGALDNSPHFDPEGRGAAPEYRAYAGHDAERAQYLQMLKDGMGLEEMGLSSVRELASVLSVDEDIAEALCDGYGCA